MADFEAPSFSLGLDFDQFDSNSKIISSIHDFETLIVDDSDPDYPDPNHKPNRLFRTGIRTQNNVKNAPELVTTTCNVGNSRRFQDIDSDSDTNEPSVSYMKCNVSDSYLNSSLRQCTRIDLDETLPPAHCYFFNCDVRIQELVRSRLCHFSPLSDELNRGFEQLDYMGQFGFGESSKQDDGNIVGKKSSTRRRFSGKLKNDELSSPGWVNPKLGVDKVTTKGVTKRKLHGGIQSPGQWLTGSDGKKVYVGKNGQELTGRVAYMRYKKDNGSGFKKSKRKFFYKKKK